MKPVAQQTARGQFRVKDLLAFVVACGLFFWLCRETPGIASSWSGGASVTDTLFCISVWLALGFYYKSSLPTTLIVHCTAAGSILVLVLLLSVLNALMEPENLGVHECFRGLITLASAATMLASLYSCPCHVLLIIEAAVKNWRGTGKATTIRPAQELDDGLISLAEFRAIRGSQRRSELYQRHRPPSRRTYPPG